MKTKQRLLVCLFFASILYLGSFVIQSSVITSKIAIILATGPLLYAITLYSIKTKVKIFDDPLGVDIDRKSFFGKGFYVLSISLVFILVGFQWTHHISLWIQANGVWTFESLWFFLFVATIIIIMVYQIFRKETRMYWSQIPYIKRVRISSLQIGLVIWALVYNPESLWQSIVSISVVFLILFSLALIRKSYVDQQIKKSRSQKRKSIHYHDQFVKHKDLDSVSKMY